MQRYIENDEQIEYKPDCEKLVEVALSNDVLLTIKQAHDLWSRASESYCATWLNIDGMNDEEIWRCLGNEIPKSGYLIDEENEKVEQPNMEPYEFPWDMNDPEVGEVVLKFKELEETLHGQENNYYHFANFVCETADGKPSIADARQTVNAFHDVQKQYGHDIAVSIYNSMAVVIPWEICNRGGKLDQVRNLADAGIFMEYEYTALTDEMKRKLVEYANGGGSAENAFDHLYGRDIDEELEV